MRVRDICYEGSLRNTRIKVSWGRLPMENVIPREEASYIAMGMKKDVSDTKIADLLTMYNTFIPRDRCLNFLPPP